jgi:hypothetical protein
VLPGLVLKFQRQQDNDLRARREPTDEKATRVCALVGKDFLEETFSFDLKKSASQKEQWQEELIEAIYQDASPQRITNPASFNHFLDSGEISVPVACFLQSLGFDEMTSRHTQIEKAHESTFKWIFEDQTGCLQSWSDFPSWLAANSQTSTSVESNIYWITGKAGSGKSTMMKYLYCQESTTRYLRQWAGDRPLTLAAFFFWAAPNAERSLLNTQEGLLRTLLHQIFSQKPNMIELACPRRWDAIRLFGFDSHNWTWEELLNTVRLVLENSEACYFFLIDGLDEFDGDQSGLLEFVGMLANNSRIKICVSSRPWPVFEDKFGCCDHLMLHHLTARDIKHYTTTKLLQSRAFVELKSSKQTVAMRLVDDITSKSRGVFLWVRIVVRELYEGLLDGDRETQLRERLEGLPAELENLFQNILDNLRSRHKRDASLLFQIVQAARSPLNLLSLSFADNDDPDFAVKLQLGPLSEDDCLYQCSNMRRRLNSRCRGLLELVDAEEVDTGARSSLSQPWMSDEFVATELIQDPGDRQQYISMLSKSRVQYMHRTVKDYIKKDNVWKTLLEATPGGFNPHAALCRASLVELKIQDPMTLDRAKFWSKIYQVLHYAALAEHTSQTAHTSILDELDCVGEQYSRVLSLTALHHAPQPGTRSRPKPPNPHDHPKELHWTVTQSKGARDYSFMCLAVQFGLMHYVKAKLESNRALIQQKNPSRSLLDCAVLDFSFLSDFSERPPPQTAQNIELVKLLLEAGDDPNRVDYLKGTPWKHVLGRVKEEHARAEERQRRGLTSELNHMDHWIQVAELFIRNGADCWRRLDSETKKAFQTHDTNGAKSLEKILKKERRSWGRIRRAIAGR